MQMVSPKPYGVNSRVRGPEKERGDGVLSSEVLLSKAVLPPSTTSRPRRASEPGEDATPSRPAWESGTRKEDVVVNVQQYHLNIYATHVIKVGGVSPR